MLLRLRVALGYMLLVALRVVAWLGHLVVPKDSMLYRRLARARKSLRGTPGSKIAELLKAYARTADEVFFVQIGANDGVLEDPLRPFVVKHCWRGVLVEPLKPTFERLKANYAGTPGLIFENVAVAPQAGTQEFFYIDDAGAADPELPPWHEGLGSLSREVVLKHAAEYPAIARHLVTQRVDCITFAELCARNQIDRIDVLSIDAEGYDFEILKLIDFARYRPLILLYEHHHMSVEQREACGARLARYGYESFREILNTACLNVAALERRHVRLRSAWNGLKRIEWIPV